MRHTALIQTANRSYLTLFMKTIEQKHDFLKINKKGLQQKVANKKYHQKHHSTLSDFPTPL